MFDKLNEVLGWLDKGWITAEQFESWVAWREFQAFSIRCKDLA